ncbi:MAG: putative nucleotidyltransferase substrate binding domain-containing protein [Alphaproteobacteria bacterium]
MHSLSAIFRNRVAERPLPPAVTVAPDAACADAVRRMREARASAAIVVAPDGSPVGIVTEQDIVRRAAFAVPPDAPVATIMSAPVETIRSDATLYEAIARMRRLELRHMPVVQHGKVIGLLPLDQAYGTSIGRMLDLIDRLSHDSSVDGLRHVKAAQVGLAEALFAENVPAPEIQALLSDINGDIYRRILRLTAAELAAAGRGPAPVDYSVLIMGSGGRGESFLFPDQDNGFILDDYPDAEHDRIDGWFIALAERMTSLLDAVGIPLCKGYVMAVNPLWRKTRPQWRAQMQAWMRQRYGASARFADIFFDFRSVYGNPGFADELRAHVTPLVAGHRAFLRDMYDLQAEHDVALGWLGRFRTETRAGPDRGRLNLKYGGTLPLVEGVRLLALAEAIPATSTVERLRGLAAKGALPADRLGDLLAAFDILTAVLLRQQMLDFRAGRPVGNYVQLAALPARERRLLREAMRAIRAFRLELRGRMTEGVL